MGSVGKHSFEGLFPPFKHQAALGILCEPRPLPAPGCGLARSSGSRPAAPSRRGQHRHLVSCRPSLGGRPRGACDHRLCGPLPTHTLPPSHPAWGHTRPQPADHSLSREPPAATSTQSPGTPGLSCPLPAAGGGPSLPLEAPAPTCLLLPPSGHPLFQEALSMPADTLSAPQVPLHLLPPSGPNP